MTDQVMKGICSGLSIGIKASKAKAKAFDFGRRNMDHVCREEVLCFWMEQF
jgi:hypothetical protein